MTKGWHLEEGIYAVRAIQSSLREFGYHVTLGGGLLNNGYSDKDLDLYFLPMGGFGKTKLTNQPDKLLAYLTGMWGEPKPIGKKLPDDGVVYHYKLPHANPNVPPDFAGRLRAADLLQPARAPIGHWLEPNAAANAADFPVQRIPRPPAIDINNIDREIEDELFKKATKEYDQATIGIYKHAVTFYRNGNERIDCFIF